MLYEVITLRTRWMQLRPDVIYLTGGASKSNAIAQVVARNNFV